MLNTSTIQSRPAPLPKLLTRPPTAWSELLLVSRAGGEELQRVLGRLPAAVRVVRSIAEAKVAFSARTSGIILDAPLPDLPAEDAVRTLAQIDAARMLPVFIIVEDGFCDARARALYDAGATAVVGWPSEVLLIPQIVAEMLEITLADHEASTIDHALTDAASARLAVDPELAGEVTCSVRAGVGFLRGRVDSLWKLRRARGRIESVPGVAAIETSQVELDVATVDDDELASALRTVVASSTGIESKAVSLTVRDGEVSLAGVVGSRRELRRLRSVIENVRGVKAIVNLVTVSGAAVAAAKSTADHLEGLVRAALPAEDIRVSVLGSVAVLTGAASTLAARSEVAEIVEDCDAVSRIVNKVRVRGA